MNSSNKRLNQMDVNGAAIKRVKKECSYGERCYRLNPAHFREYSHRHLESILDNYSGTGAFPIPESLSLQRGMINDQLAVIVEKQLYEPKTDMEESKDKTTQKRPGEFSPEESSRTSDSSNKPEVENPPDLCIDLTDTLESKHTPKKPKGMFTFKSPSQGASQPAAGPSTSRVGDESTLRMGSKEEGESTTSQPDNKPRESSYRPIVPPTRRAEQYLSVVAPRGRMADKHAASAPYHIFYTTIAAAPHTHNQPYSITFQEILDRSLGELKCSLQINFMVEISWLLAQYYFAGYSEKRLSILYGDESMPDLKDINRKKPQVHAHHVAMDTPFGKHHTKLMLLCYEDGSVRVVVSTANLYSDDWENRTQGLWMSPRCPRMADAVPQLDGESPTMFKRSLIDYLQRYNVPHLSRYIAMVRRCDFRHINVFLVASIPGSHYDMCWGLPRVGTLLRQHCAIPPADHARWPLLAQASSIGSYGKDPKMWLTGDFLHYFSKLKNQPQALCAPPPLKLIYPSLENVRQSHDGLLGGGCLPYAAETHMKQQWLNNYLYQWKATSSHRNQAMPHIKSYTRVSPDNKQAAFFLLTSSNVSKAAWGSINKGNRALRLLSYEAGVLFMPRFVINEDFFPLEEGAENRLVIPYDLPPTKYTAHMNPWVSDNLR